MGVILRPQKFVHHSCEYTQRLYDARTNDRERRTRSPLNFKHAQKSDATAGERKIACNGSDSRATLASHRTNAKKQDCKVF